MSEKSKNIRWRSTHKLKHLADSFYLKNELLGAYVRKNGLHLSDLKSWKEEAYEAFDGARPMRNEEKKRLEIKIKFLEKELEKAHLKIELQKKAQEILNPKSEEKSLTSNKEEKSSDSLESLEEED